MKQNCGHKIPSFFKRQMLFFDTIKTKHTSCNVTVVPDDSSCGILIDMITIDDLACLLGIAEG